MHVTSDTIRRAFDSATYNRGLGYARDGFVGDVRFRGDRLVGEVRGSGWNVYQQVIRLMPGRDGMQFHGSCTCPMAHNCKHVVAVLLTGVERHVLAPAQEIGLSLPASLWLAQLAQLQASAPAKAPARVSSFRLAYVLCPDARTGEPDLLLCKAKTRGDGKIVSATVLANMSSLRYTLPDYIAPEDHTPIRLYDDMWGRSAFGVSKCPAGRPGGQLLSLLGREGRLHWALQRDQIKTGQLTPVLRGDGRSATLGWHPTAEGADTVGLRWQFDDGMPIEHVFATEPVYYLHSGFLGELKLPPSLAAMPIGALVDLLHDSPVLDAHEREHMAQRMVDLGLHQVVPPPQVVAPTVRDDIVPVPTLVLDSMLVLDRRGHQNWHDYAVPGFDYDGVYTDALDRSPLPRRRVGNALEQIVRNAALEKAAAQRLAALGFHLPAPDAPLGSQETALQLATQAEWLQFAQFELDGLRAAGWQIVLNDDYRYNLAQVDDWYAEVDEQDEGGHAWFALELGIIVDGRRQPLLPLLVQLIRQAPQGFRPAALAAHADSSPMLLQLPGGEHVVLPWGRIKPILAILGELYFRGESEAAIHLPVIDAARLAELEQAAQLRWLGGERLRALGRRLAQFGGVAEVPKPAGLQAELRTYQREGVAWMQFLREFGFAGILADDMGLGKTLQTLTHILIEKEAGRLDAPALVVVPTSLVGNWCAEAARFTPGLRVLTLHGKDRQAQFEHIASADIVLTTYALLPRDEATLRGHTFHLLILDESQYIKNSRAKAAQTARLLTARHRLCLTGTPLQNHLGELWSQFHFLMPGLLGEEKTFNVHFRKPIEVQHDSDRNAFLTRRVKPFMLRRTKDKVASELPPKTEIVLPVELGSGQRDLYETVRVAMDKRVRDEIGRKGVARSQIVILDALLKMRQVCCDPRLVKGTGLKAAKSAAGSAKLDTLLELLDTLLSEGRKVLVFSQFTSMLELIGTALRERALDYVTLTGETEDRCTPIDAFQRGDVPLFLISLKAGGVGLNLTAADIVIHYDPWWNPAAENQATDRAWRIGQDKPVFVYKLIAQGTLEEKIQELQRRKGELADAVMGEGGQLNAALTQEDLQAIFAPL
ncbi:DEAD/DEAH box helicase [Massilia sp. YMA4]|uniref:DEAD/DEAH box helicase n=1 Tax=Massilia sp. YMA4 TaxID=1593482 RepID=UPI000DD13E14|nr:DEAD/DEAH box helicase [Massilia sp. YMA4]AXA93416.1 helicase [Massilia sp. YMA4]